MYSEYSKFHPNSFTFGGVIAKRVNTAKTRRKVNPIFGWSLASSHIIIFTLRDHTICRQWSLPSPHACSMDVQLKLTKAVSGATYINMDSTIAFIICVDMYTTLYPDRYKWYICFTKFTTTLVHFYYNWTIKASTYSHRMPCSRTETMGVKMGWTDRGAIGAGRSGCQIEKALLSSKFEFSFRNSTFWCILSAIKHTWISLECVYLH